MEKPTKRQNVSCGICRFCNCLQKVFVLFIICEYNKIENVSLEEKILRGKESIIDKIGKVVTVAGTAVLMNLLFLVACIPVVTIGQAWCGLISAVRFNVRGEKWFDGFKFGFKKRFLRGTVSWCIMLVVDVYFLLQVSAASQYGVDTPLIGACIVFAMMTMLTMALQMLNVYIPTDVGNWVRNATNMVFKAPLMLLLAALLFWLPIILLVIFPAIFVYSVMIYIAAYYALAALVATLVLKNTLLEYLVQARADGTLTAEEGKQKDNGEV